MIGAGPANVTIVLPRNPGRKISGGEFGLIERIKKQLPAPREGLLAGIGDDAAVIEPPRGKLLASMDLLLEGVHFDLDLTTPSLLGAKALAVNASDMAAMGGRPLYALVSLGLTARQDDDFVAALYEGMQELAAALGVQIAGGDTTASRGGLVLDVAILGEAKAPVRRSGAGPGEFLAVTGTLGDAAAGLAWLMAYKEKLIRERVFVTHGPAQWPVWAAGEARQCAMAQLRPEPRVEAGLALAGGGLAGAMQDVSDGLASEVNHIAAASGVGAVVFWPRLPVSQATMVVGEILGADPWAWALKGGEDYQLLFTFRPQDLPRVRAALHEAGTCFTVVGEILASGAGVWLEDGDGARRPLLPEGYNHLRES